MFIITIDFRIDQLTCCGCTCNGTSEEDNKKDKSRPMSNYYCRSACLCSLQASAVIEWKTLFCQNGRFTYRNGFLIFHWRLDGSGWTDVCGKSQICTPGRGDSFLRGSKVTRTRYAYQITLKVLLQLSKEAFNNSSSCEYNEWVNERKAASTSAYYWFTAVEMIVTLFMFVRSIRKSNFINYVNILKVMMLCFVALDHVITLDE